MKTLIKLPNGITIESDNVEVSETTVVSTSNKDESKFIEEVKALAAKYNLKDWFACTLTNSAGETSKDSKVSRAMDRYNSGNDPVSTDRFHKELKKMLGQE